MNDFAGFTNRDCENKAELRDFSFGTAPGDFGDDGRLGITVHRTGAAHWGQRGEKPDSIRYDT